MPRRLRLFSAIALVTLAAPLSTIAAADDAATCRSTGQEATAACTRIITSPGATRDQVGDAYINRGQSYYRKKEYERALEDFNKAIPLKPKWVQLAYSNRGNVYYAKGEDQNAIDSYDKAIAIDPNYPAAYTARGLLYEKAGAVGRARTDFNAALGAKSKFEDDAWAHDTARKHLEALKGK